MPNTRCSWVGPVVVTPDPTPALTPDSAALATGAVPDALPSAAGVAVVVVAGAAAAVVAAVAACGAGASSIKGFLVAQPDRHAASARHNAPAAVDVRRTA